MERSGAIWSDLDIIILARCYVEYVRGDNTFGGREVPRMLHVRVGWPRDPCLADDGPRVVFRERWAGVANDRRRGASGHASNLSEIAALVE